MVRHLIICLISICLSISYSFAQVPLVDLEKQIILSDDYFYNKATAKDDKEAKNLSRSILLRNTELLDYLKANNIPIATVEINYLLKSMDNLTRCIAYIQKHTNVQSNSSNNTTEKGNMTAGKKAMELNNNISLNFPSKFSSLQMLNSCEDIWIELNALKRKGSLVFSTSKEVFDNINECFLLICKSNKLIAFFDVGSEIRYDFISKEKKDIKIYENEKNNIPIYVYVF